MGVGGRLIGHEGMVPANVREEAMDGEAETETDTGIMKANEALRRVKNIPVARRADFNISPKKGFDQAYFSISNGEQTGFGGSNGLVLSVPTFNGVGLGRCDGGTKKEANTGRRSWRVLGHPSRSMTGVAEEEGEEETTTGLETEEADEEGTADMAERRTRNQKEMREAETDLVGRKVETVKVREQNETKNTVEQRHNGDENSGSIEG